MHVVIVYESLFSNTHEIAEAVGEGVRKACPEAQVTCVRASETDADAVKGADLVVVGGPTHMMRMSSARTRLMGLQAKEKEPAGKATAYRVEPGAAGPGVREWLDALPKAAGGSRAAAFDTRLPSPMAGGAASSIARRLRWHGYTLAARPAGFIVEDMHGPLRSGERDRAQAWGAGLAA